MTDLKAVYDSLEDIPESVEDFRSLFVERDGRFELSGLPGVKTAADIERLQKNLNLERESHKQTKEKFRPFAELDADEVFTKLDRIPELEALREQNAALAQERSSRQRQDALRPIMAKAGVLPEHYEDVELYAERHLEQNEDGGWQTRDQVGVTPGLAPQEWLGEMLQKRPGWLPANVGGGAKGSGAGGASGSNPFSAKGWNLTAQGQLVQSRGMEYAERLASAAGTKVGGARPRE